MVLARGESISVYQCAARDRGTASKERDLSGGGSGGSGEFFKQGDEKAVGVEDAGQEAKSALGREALVETDGGDRGEDGFAEQGIEARVERDLAGAGGFGENGGKDLLVFLGFQGAGGVDDVATGANGAQGRGEDGALALGLTREVFGAEAMADFRVAAQSAGAAAGNVGEGEGEIGGRIFCQRGGVGEAAFNLIRMSGEALAQLVEALRAGFAGEDAGLRIALGQDESFAAGGRASIYDAFYFLGGILVGAGCNFCDELRALVLEADAAIEEGRGGGDVAGNNGAGVGEQFAGGKLDASCGEFGFDAGAGDADGEDGLGLAVEADGVGGFKAVDGGPALNHPGGVGLGGGCLFWRYFLGG
jgi:hypothetical protein